MKIARIYCRVSTEQQNLERQQKLADEARRLGYYVAKVYAEKGSGVNPNRPKLEELIDDLQPNDVVIAEHIDRLSRLPLIEAEKLIARIKEKGAYIAVPQIIDLNELNPSSEMERIILEACQSMLLKIALNMAHEDYETRRQRQREGIEEAKKKGRYQGRPADLKQHEQIISIRPHNTIKETARLVGCSEATVKRVWAEYKRKLADEDATTNNSSLLSK